MLRRLAITLLLFFCAGGLAAQQMHPLTGERYSTPARPGEVLSDGDGFLVLEGNRSVRLDGDGNVLDDQWRNTGAPAFDDLAWVWTGQSYLVAWGGYGQRISLLGLDRNGLASWTEPIEVASGNSFGHPQIVRAGACYLVVYTRGDGGLWARRVDASGRLLGPEFALSTASIFQPPSLVAFDDHAMVVIHESDGGRFHIRILEVDEASVRESPVGTNALSSQPLLASTHDGGALMIWAEGGTLRVTKLDASGTPVSHQILGSGYRSIGVTRAVPIAGGVLLLGWVLPPGDPGQYSRASSTLLSDDGEMLRPWSPSAAFDFRSLASNGRRAVGIENGWLQSDAVMIGPDGLVARRITFPTLAASFFGPGIACGPTNCLAAWLESDGEMDVIRTRIVGFDGVPVEGSEAVLARIEQGYEGFRLAAGPGGFMVAWATGIYDAIDVYARRIGFDGRPAGGPIFLAHSGALPAIATDGDRWLFAWADHGNENPEVVAIATAVVTADGTVQRRDTVPGPFYSAWNVSRLLWTGDRYAMTFDDNAGRGCQITCPTPDISIWYATLSRWGEPLLAPRRLARGDITPGGVARLGQSLLVTWWTNDERTWTREESLLALRVSLADGSVSAPQRLPRVLEGLARPATWDDHSVAFPFSNENASTYGWGRVDEALELISIGTPFTSAAPVLPPLPGGSFLLLSTDAPFPSVGEAKAPQATADLALQVDGLSETVVEDAQHVRVLTVANRAATPATGVTLKVTAGWGQSAVVDGGEACVSGTYPPYAITCTWPALDPGESRAVAIRTTYGVDRARFLSSPTTWFDAVVSAREIDVSTRDNLVSEAVRIELKRLRSVRR